MEWPAPGRFPARGRPGARALLRAPSILKDGAGVAGAMVRRLFQAWLQPPEARQSQAVPQPALHWFVTFVAAAAAQPERPRSEARHAPEPVGRPGCATPWRRPRPPRTG